MAAGRWRRAAPPAAMALAEEALRKQLGKVRAGPGRSTAGAGGEGAERCRGGGGGRRRRRDVVENAEFLGGVEGTGRAAREMRCLAAPAGGRSRGREGAGWGRAALRGRAAQPPSRCPQAARSRLWCPGHRL